MAVLQTETILRGSSNERPPDPSSLFSRQLDKQIKPEEKTRLLLRASI